MRPARAPRSGLVAPALGAGVWALAAAAMALLQAQLDLAGLAMLLVLAAALAALWWSPSASVLGCAVAVAAFNWSFVPPRGTLQVDLRQHALLLATMLAVSTTIAVLTARERAARRREREAAGRQAELMDADARLRQAADVDDAGEGVVGVAAMLAEAAAADWAVLLRAHPAGERWLGMPVQADERTGLALCAELGQAFGPGTGRHEDQPAWYLPLRGRGRTAGALLLRPRAGPADGPGATLPPHAQALADRLGLWMEHAAALAHARTEREAAQAQQLRNTLLAAISHDYRTPLATILGAASSLQQQDARLSPAQRQRLAAVIVDEAEQPGRLTENTLQLARLDGPGLALRRDWESAEELVGSVLARVRRRDPGRRLRAWVEPALPLLHCDAVLLVQLLENLVDNALQYAPAGTPVELRAQRQGEHVVLAVRDRGLGVAPAWRRRIFEPFERGPAEEAAAGAAAKPGRPRRGAGVGLALCRAIAEAHGGSLRLRARRQGGAAFECWLPAAEPPALPAGETG